VNVEFSKVTQDLARSAVRWIGVSTPPVGKSHATVADWSSKRTFWILAQNGLKETVERTVPELVHQ